MKIIVHKSRIEGEIVIPGSKSHTIRAVAVATFADGISSIYSPLESGDTRSSLMAARAFGARVDEQEDCWIVHGIGSDLQKRMDREITVDMGNSGTSLRIFTGLAAVSDCRVNFDGDSSLRSRPMLPLLDALSTLGVKVESKNGKCPIAVQGPIRGGEAHIEGKSSQFLTSLLFAAPLAKADSRITVSNLNEKPYVEITLGWLKSQNINLEHSEDLTEFNIQGNQEYHAFSRTIPADFSTATFPLAATAVTGGRLNIDNLDFEDCQGDKVVFDYFRQMGVEINKSSEGTLVSVQERLKGLELDLNATPDALPAVAVTACVLEGETVIKNVPQARIKETDRITCMTSELRKMGAEIKELDDGMVIKGGILEGAKVEGFNDHRIVMALTIAGLAAEGETVINGAEAAAITYPDFVRDFKKIGADITLIED